MIKPRKSQITVNQTKAVFAGLGESQKSGIMLDGVQYLRGLCAVIVVISHCNGIIGKPEHYSRLAIPDWSTASLFAVAAFFSISGLIIVIASLDGSLAPRTTCTEFLRRRFVRIVPFLWLCTIGYNLLSWAGTGTFEWSAAIRTLVVWPVGELKPNVAWSLRHELLFYLFYAVAVLGARRRPGLLIAWFAASALFYITSYELDAAGGVTQALWFEALKVMMGGDHGANFQFAVGMGLAYLYLVRPTKLPIGKVPPVLIAGSAGLACVIVTLAPSHFGLPVALLWTALAAVVLASAVCATPAAGIAGRLGLVLGNASFAIYLVHNPIVLVLLAAAAKMHLALPGQAALVAFMTACVVVAVVGGIVVHYAVEAPLIRACDRWTRKGDRVPARLPVH